MYRLKDNKNLSLQNQEDIRSNLKKCVLQRKSKCILVNHFNGFAMYSWLGSNQASLKRGKGVGRGNGKGVVESFARKYSQFESIVLD